MLKKIVIVLALAVLAVLGLVIARRMAFPTAPSGAGEAALGDARWQLPEARAAIAEKLAPVRRTASAELLLDEADVRELAIVELAAREDGRRVLAAAQDLEVEISGDRVSLGVIVNLARIPDEGLSDDVRNSLDGLRKLLMLVGDRDVYFGLTGTPAAAAGGLTFSADSRVKVGFVDMALDDFVERVGIASAAEVEERLRFELTGLEVERVEVLDGRLKLVASERASG